jgi:predicted GNAT family N-acyltransferase
MTYEILLTDSNSKYYEEVLMIRQDVLRTPLGLTLSQEDIEDDKNQQIIIALDNEKVVGCLFVKIVSQDKVKFRQMAIAEKYQHQGIGKSIIRFAEDFCILNQHKKIELHARKTAIDFYQKQHFQMLGEVFYEVGISHIKMVKQIG